MSEAPIPQYLLPDTATIDASGAMSIGGVNLLDIAAAYGTPAFVYDEQHLVNRCNEAVAAFPDGVAYASKAFLCMEMVRVAARCGMRIDVASGGELFVALKAGVDPSKIVMHGNNKSLTELEAAIEAGVGLIVIDSFDEIERIESLAPSKPVECLVRVNPGVEVHTYDAVRTGQTDSKFGLGLASGQAQEAVDRMRASKAFNLVGAHSHVGSYVFDTAPYAQAVETLIPFVVKNDFEELCLGGGLGAAYETGDSVDSTLR